jgi:hypothetical protein
MRLFIYVKMIGYGITPSIVAEHDLFRRTLKLKIFHIPDPNNPEPTFPRLFGRAE